MDPVVPILITETEGFQAGLPGGKVFMPESGLIQTNIYGFDAIAGGGIPQGNIILVEGQVGAGKTIFGTEFVYRGAVQGGEAGIIIVFETSPQKLIRDSKEFGW